MHSPAKHIAILPESQAGHVDSEGTSELGLSAHALFVLRHRRVRRALHICRSTKRVGSAIASRTATPSDVVAHGWLQEKSIAGRRHVVRKRYEATQI